MRASLIPPMLVALYLLGCPAADDDDDYWSDLNLTSQASTDAGTFELTYTPDPSPIVLNENFSVVLTVEDESGAVEGAAVALDANMPAHGHGMTVVPVVEELGDGRYSFAPLLFHMAGHWEIVATVDDGGGEETGLFDYRCCE